MSEPQYRHTGLLSSADNRSDDHRNPVLNSPKIGLAELQTHNPIPGPTEHLPPHGQEGSSHPVSDPNNRLIGPAFDGKGAGIPVPHAHQSLNTSIEDAHMDKMSYTDDGLDQEIQRAIAQHDLQQQQLQQSGSAASDTILSLSHHNGKGRMEGSYTENGEQMDQNDEKEHLEMIADELKRATSSEKHSGLHSDQAAGTNTSLFDHANGEYGTILQSNYDHHGTYEQGTSDVAGSFGGGHNYVNNRQTRAAHIPADSELLATNTALAAYNALSSHVPLVALLASVHLAALPLPIVAPDYLPARIQLLVDTLPVLDNLATQMLRYFAVGPYQKIFDLASSPDTAPGAAFRDLVSLFEVTKRLYSEEDPFITVEHIAPGMWKEGDKTLSVFRNREQSIESTLRKVNLATFLAATLGLLEAGFFHLNEAFLSVFCPLNSLDPANSMSNMSPTNMNLQSITNNVIGDKFGKLFKPQASLYLDLKTQAFISGMVAGERSREAILEDVFPSNLEEILLKRRGVKTLSPTEIDFVNRCRSRKEALLKSESDNFSEQYEWYGFLRDLFELVFKDMSLLIWGKRVKTFASRNDRSFTPGRGHDDSSLTSDSDEALQGLSTTIPRSERDGLESVGRDGAPSLSGSTEVNASQEIKDITAGLLPSEIQEQQIHLRVNPGKISNRRPWTREEEKALRYALELKGPHWSTILELFGQGGLINESLKNRTQVQLKDKARNWKMFFLKSQLPVPDYLKRVTGNLDREDKLRAKFARSKKTAAAPVPAVAKRDMNIEPGKESSNAKRHKI